MEIRTMGDLVKLGRHIEKNYPGQGTTPLVVMAEDNDHIIHQMGYMDFAIVDKLELDGGMAEIKSTKQAELKLYAF